MVVLNSRNKVVLIRINFQGFSMFFHQIIQGRQAPDVFGP